MLKPVDVEREVFTTLIISASSSFHKTASTVNLKKS